MFLKLTVACSVREHQGHHGRGILGFGVGEILICEGYHPRLCVQDLVSDDSEAGHCGRVLSRE